MPFAYHALIAGHRLSGVVDYLLPTMQLAFGLMGAAKARGRSVAWGLLAVVGPVGVAVVYRWPLRVVPVALPPPPPRSPLIVGAVTLAQIIIVVHTVATYPWDHPHQWIGDLIAYGFVSTAMIPPLVRPLLDRGYGTSWAALALLGPPGLIVIYFLPDRTRWPAAGFAVLSVRSPRRRLSDR